MTNINAKEATRKVIEIFGQEVLLNFNLFLFAYKDVAPNLKIEASILMTALQRGIGSIFLLSREEQQNATIEKVRRNLSEVLSDDAISIVVECISYALDWKITSVDTISDQWEQYQKGYNYELGENGVNQNYIEAFKWYKLSSAQGNAWAQNRLGDFYKFGKGVVKDEKEAVKWYQKSANQGDYTAQYNLGLCYFHGEGVTQDYLKAIEYFDKSSKQGNEWAQYMLGFIYELGKGVTIDYVEAIKWYKCSANQGNAWSQNRLGDCYRYGNGVKKDNEEAIRWYRLSAEQGDSTAEENLKQCLK